MSRAPDAAAAPTQLWQCCGTGPCPAMGTLGDRRLLLCCAFWGLCLASDYDGECVPLGANCFLVKGWAFGTFVRSLKSYF